MEGALDGTEVLHALNVNWACYVSLPEECCVRAVFLIDSCFFSLQVSAYVYVGCAVLCPLPSAAIQCSAFVLDIIRTSDFLG